MAGNAAQLSFLAITLFAIFVAASSTPAHSGAGNLRTHHSLLSTASVVHRNESEPEAAQPTEEAKPVADAPTQPEAAQTAEEAAETVETKQEEAPSDEDDSTEDEADTTQHHGEDHEHSGSPGKGEGNMVPRSHVHGEHNESHHEFHWSYAAPQKWAGGYALCDGEAQSPIDIETGAAVSGEAGDSIDKRSAYVPLDGRQVHDNGHNVQVNGEFGTLEMPDGMYEVKQFHFHFPSEHQVNGRLAAGEIHIVHQKMGSQGTNDLAVVGILLDTETTLAGDFDAKERKKELDFLTNIGFGRSLPKLDEDIAIEAEVDLNAFSKELSGPFFHYKGSLTTPPCSETVHWYVLEQAAVVTPEMMDSFKAIFPSPANNRPVRPLNGRKVMFSSAEIQGEFASEDSGKATEGAATIKSGSASTSLGFGLVAMITLGLALSD